MGTLIQADIFFFISSISVVVLSIFILIIFYYIIKASKNLRDITDSLKATLADSKEYTEELVARLEHNFIFRLFFPPISKKREAKKSKINK
jgi:hypothetical protein